MAEVRLTLIYVPRVLSVFRGAMLALSVLLAAPVSAQEEEAAGNEAVEALAQILSAEQEPEFVDPLGRGTPRSSALAFLAAAERGDFQSAAEYMDFRNLPAAMRDMDQAELAEQIYLVISRALWLDIENISDDPAGAAGDGLPSFRDAVGQVALEEDSVLLLMQRVPADEAGQFVWKLSNATVARIPSLYEVYGYPVWIEEFRAWFPTRVSFLGVEFWKVVLVLCVGVVLWPVLWLAFVALARLFSSPRSPLYPEVRKLLTRPLLFLVLVIVLNWFLRELGLGATAQKIASAHTTMTAITVWLLFSIIDLVRSKRRERFLEQGRTDAAVLGRPVANALKLLIALLGVLVWLSNMGVNISALLAGLGIGGIAMALALQKPIEDLFGAITLYSQRPVATGDFCRYGQHLGRIEEIGLRSTRIRTQGNTVVSIPNSRLAYEDIENISARQCVWYQPLVRLRIDTTPDQIREIVERTRRMLIDDQRVLNDVLRVQFREFGQFSLDVKVHCYIDTTDFTEYLNIAEQLNFGILEIVHQVGASLALPERGLME